MLTFLARKPAGLYAKRNNSIEAVQHLEKILRSRKLKHFRHKSFALQYVSFFFERAQGVNEPPDESNGLKYGRTLYWARPHRLRQRTEQQQTEVHLT